MKWAWRLALALAVPALLAACASHPARPGKKASARHARGGDNIHLSQQDRYHFKQDGEPDGPARDVSKLPEPVPKVEPLSRYGNKSPYAVNGKTYRVLADARGYDERGLASWYGNKFHGYLTSSMERYDMYKFTAASKVLPLPTYARVTNLENGKSVIVRVNDRGPFVSNRIIDLSYAAAVRIGIWPKGTGMVEVQAIDPRHPRAELKKPPVVPVDAAGHGIWLQVGAYSDRSNAREVAARLRRARLAPVQVTAVDVSGRRYTRVRLGPLKSAAEADRVSAAVQRLGLPAPRVAVD